MGRGIDFRGVNLVINYDLPPSGISYVHRYIFNLHNRAQNSFNFDLKKT